MNFERLAWNFLACDEVFSIPRKQHEEIHNTWAYSYPSSLTALVISLTQSDKPIALASLAVCRDALPSAVQTWPCAPSITITTSLATLRESNDRV